MEVGRVVTGTVEEVKKTHIILTFKNGFKGMCHVSEVSDYFVQNISSMFKVGERHQFKVINIDQENNRVKLSWKDIHPRFLRNPFDYDVEETTNGFKNLLEFTMKEVNND